MKVIAQFQIVVAFILGTFALTTFASSLGSVTASCYSLEKSCSASCRHDPNTGCLDAEQIKNCFSTCLEENETEAKECKNHLVEVLEEYLSKWLDEFQPTRTVVETGTSTSPVATASISTSAPTTLRQRRDSCSDGDCPWCSSDSDCESCDNCKSSCQLVTDE
eukprot:Awhi_evm2s4509